MILRDFIISKAPAELPETFFESLMDEIGCNPDDDFKDIDIQTKNRAMARMYLFLATVPNVSEGGVSISFSSMDKKIFLDLARRYANLAGETELVPGTIYGYKGQNL